MRSPKSTWPTPPEVVSGPGSRRPPPSSTNTSRTPSPATTANRRKQKTMKSIHERAAKESLAAITAWHENPWRCPVACGDTRTLVWHPYVPERAYMSCECRRWWPAPDGAVALARQELSEREFREHTVPVPVAGLRRTRVRVDLNDSTVSITTPANRSAA